MAMMHVEGTEVYTVTVRGPVEGTAVSFKLVTIMDDLGLDRDAVAEALRAHLVGLVPDSPASFTDKAINTETALFPQ